MSRTIEEDAAAARALVSAFAPLLPPDFTHAATREVELWHPDDALDYLLLGVLEGDAQLPDDLRAMAVDYIGGMEDVGFAERLRGHLAKIEANTPATP